MRFPRIKRIHRNKPAAEADRLETLEAMMEGVGSAEMARLDADS